MPTAGSLRLTIHVGGEKQLGGRLHGLLDRLDDLRPAFEEIVEDWRESRVEIFAAEGAHDGLPAWPELSEKYARWKERHYPGRFILTRTGELQRSLVFPEVDMSAHGLTLTINNSYAIFHQAKSRGKAQFQRRQIASLGARQKSRWLTILRNHMFNE